MIFQYGFPDVDVAIRKKSGPMLEKALDDFLTIEFPVLPFLLDHLEKVIEKKEWALQGVINPQYIKHFIVSVLTR